MTFYAKKFEELTNTQVYEILKSRCQIFLMEQDIRCMDMDDVDYKSLHCFLEEDNRICAYLRAFYPYEDQSCVKIGRVLTLEHGKGYGAALMTQSLDIIKKLMPCDVFRVDAQKQAIGYYEKMGFRVVSEEFLEEGIPHVTMILK